MAIARIVKWVAIGIVAVCVLLVGGLFVFSGSIVGPAPAPLQLSPLSPATTTTGIASADGTWTAGSGSLAGFRVPESFLVQSGTIVGRTSAMTGSLVISDNTISSGSIQVDLSKLTIGDKQNTSFVKLLDTASNPTATLTLTDPIIFTNIPTNGQTISSQATGALTLHGITHPITFTFTARINGSVLEVTGSAPVLASDWSIKSPFGVHDDGVIEFLVILRRE